jgi:hypothetical protein
VNFSTELDLVDNQIYKASGERIRLLPEMVYYQCSTSSYSFGDDDDDDDDVGEQEDEYEDDDN